MILHSVHASTSGAIRVAKEWRSEYKRKGRTPDSLSAMRCCFFSVLWSMWPVFVGAGHTQPSIGLPVASHLACRTPLTLGVIGSSRLAAGVLPCRDRKSVV